MFLSLQLEGGLCNMFLSKVHGINSLCSAYQPFYYACALHISQLEFSVFMFLSSSCKGHWFGNKSCIMQIHRYIERQQINTKAILQTLDLHITEKRWKVSMDIIMLSKAFYEQRGIKLYILFLWRVQTWYSDLSEGREKMMSVIMQVLSHYNI